MRFKGGPSFSVGNVVKEAQIAQTIQLPKNAPLCDVFEAKNIYLVNHFSAEQLATLHLGGYDEATG